MILAVTGHRPNKLGNDYNFTSDLSKLIIKELQKIIDTYRPTEMISGMALGIDTIWAILAIKNKIPLTCAIPCSGHTNKWMDKSIKLYNRIINDPLSTIVMVSDEPYDNFCMQRRNIWMVERCDILVAVWDGSKGGTANCVKYAEGKKEILQINPNFIL